MSQVSSDLNENSWSQISAISSSGKASQYWAVGDCKMIVLNGAVQGIDGTISHGLTFVNYITCVFIIGFNHNATVEGNNRIHFMFGKTNINNGIDICFCDSYIDHENYNGFEMKADTSYDYIDWSITYMRIRVLGTSLSNYTNTFIGALPTALRNVLKSVTKYSLQTTYSPKESTSSSVATTDYLFLLSTYEIMRTAGWTVEKTNQSQYLYYSNRNSKIKYKHDDQTLAVSWWTRTPSTQKSRSWRRIIEEGDNATAPWQNSWGIAPAFCV